MRIASLLVALSLFPAAARAEIGTDKPTSWWTAVYCSTARQGHLGETICEDAPPPKSGRFLSQVQCTGWVEQNVVPKIKAGGFDKVWSYRCEERTK